jgi:hypothetical protein
MTGRCLGHRQTKAYRSHRLTPWETARVSLVLTGRVSWIRVSVAVRLERVQGTLMHVFDATGLVSRLAQDHLPVVARDRVRPDSHVVFFPGCTSQEPDSGLRSPSRTCVAGRPRPQSHPAPLLAPALFSATHSALGRVVDQLLGACGASGTAGDRRLRLLARRIADPEDGRDSPAWHPAGYGRPSFWPP